MDKPVLVIMAAGMGSRYGGLKQIDPVDAQGDVIIDFSIYDAIQAGFEKIVFIIKKENEADFRATIGDRMEKHVQVEYAFQELTDIPEGFQVPEGRKKPFGTGHAVLACRNMVHGPFAVINADDFYGREAFRQIYQFLSTHEDEETYRYTMVGYHLGNTLTENGHVARGICSMDADENLVDIHERTRIEKRRDYAEYTEDDGATWQSLPFDTIVSMNMWGFTASILKELENRFPVFLQKEVPKNPLKSEFFLPFVVGELLEENKAQVKVLESKDKWYGVTYKEDKPVVVEAIRRMKEDGIYPEKLWEDA